MLKRFNRFLRDESGALTVDWVVLTAAVVALAGVAFTAIQSSSGGVGSGVGTYLTGVQPG
jgi:Flp pilus assembly pilin Flp